MIHAASGSFPSLSSPSFFCPLRLAVCTFCFVPGPVSHALDILLFNLPDTYHKIAIKNLVFLKKRGGGKECISQNASGCASTKYPAQNCRGPIQSGIWESGLTEASSSWAPMNTTVMGTKFGSHYFLLRVTFCSHSIGQIQSCGHSSPQSVEQGHQILSWAEKTQKYVGHRYCLLH